MDKRDTHEPEQKPDRPWRSLLALAAGIVFFIFLALLMVWIGSLVN